MESLGTEALLREVIQHSTLIKTFNIKSKGAGVITTAAPLIINKLYLKTIFTFNP